MYVDVKFQRSDATLRKATAEGRSLSQEGVVRFAAPVPAVIAQVAQVRPATEKEVAHFFLGERHQFRVVQSELGVHYETRWMCAQAQGETLTLDEALAFAESCVETTEIKAANTAYEQALQKRREEENARHEEERKARDEAAQKEQQEKAAACERLREWAHDHGSELLQRRELGGYKWEKLAHMEFAEAALKQASLGYAESETEGDVEERTTPTLDELNHLETIRDAVLNHQLDGFVTVELVWIKPHDDDDDARGFCEVEFAVTCPDGFVKKLYLTLE